jgi:hypothetical protein
MPSTLNLVDSLANMWIVLVLASEVMSHQLYGVDAVVNAFYSVIISLVELACSSGRVVPL